MSVSVLVGDALAVLRTLESESVQVVVTSPPYFGLRDYGVDGQIGLERTPLAFLEALWGVFDEVRRVLRPDGLCFVNIGDSYAGSGKGPSGTTGTGDQEQRQGFIGSKQRTNAGSLTIGSHEHEYRGIPAKNLLLIPQRFAIGMQERGWWVRSEIVWAKTSAMPESVRDRPTSAWEPIWMFAKSRAYYYDAEAVRTNAADSMVRDKRPPTSNPPGWSGNPRAIGVEATFPMGAGSTSANLRNVWMLGPDPSREQHYAAFVTEIPRRCILAGSREGDTVLDPFGGSGTTGLVADRLGRDAVLIELNPAYAEMARRRIANDAPMVSSGVTVEAPAQVSMF